jgi:DNA-binding transcriptional MerR regulator
MLQSSLIAAEEDKEPSAFRTISEVATHLGIEQHVLRFWETQFPEIKPMKLKGARRYYRPEDIEILEKIKKLLYTQGFTIKGARQALKRKNSARIRFARIAACAMPKQLPDTPALQELKNKICPTQQVVFSLSDAQRTRLQETRHALSALHAKLRAAS